MPAHPLTTTWWLTRFRHPVRTKSARSKSAELMVSLKWQLNAIADEPNLRCAIMTGSGGAFSAGDDLLEFQALLKQGGSALINTLRYNQDDIQMIEDLKLPVIAAESARLGDGHARYGVVPAGGAGVRLGVRVQQIADEICQASPEANRHIKLLTLPQAAEASANGGCGPNWIQAAEASANGGCGPNWINSSSMFLETTSPKALPHSVKSAFLIMAWANRGNPPEEPKWMETTWTE